MSEARVEFLNLSGDPVVAGERPARFSFRCVGYNRNKDPRLHPTKCAALLLAEGPHTSPHGIKHDGQGLNGGRPLWNWDGNVETPTLSPSINCEHHCGWHGYIRNGRCVSAQGVDEP